MWHIQIDSDFRLGQTSAKRLLPAFDSVLVHDGFMGIESLKTYLCRTRESLVTDDSREIPSLWVIFEETRGSCMGNESHLGLTKYCAGHDKSQKTLQIFHVQFASRGQFFKRDRPVVWNMMSYLVSVDCLHANNIVGLAISISSGNSGSITASRLT